MPLYEFQCDSCGKRWEDLQPYSAPSPACPGCKSGSVERLMPTRFGTVTDRELFRNQGTLADQFAGAEDQLDYVVKTAQRHGYRPSYTDLYLPSLARFPGDPKAFVPASGGRGHIRSVCAERGHDCEGIVQYRAPRGTRGEPPKRLSERIVERIARAKITAEPSLARRDQRELREEIIENHAVKLGA